MNKLPFLNILIHLTNYNLYCFKYFVILLSTKHIYPSCLFRRLGLNISIHLETFYNVITNILNLEIIDYSNCWTKNVIQIL